MRIYGKNKEKILGEKPTWKIISVWHERRELIREIATSLALVFVVVLAGCATHKFTSEPSGASILLAEQRDGPFKHHTVTPAKFTDWWPWYDDVFLKASKSGYIDSDVRYASNFGSSDCIEHFVLRPSPSPAAPAPEASLPQSVPSPDRVKPTTPEARPSAPSPPPSAGPKSTTNASHDGSARASVRRVKWAVVIGVSEYADTRIPQLRYASADAQAFGEWLLSPRGGYAPSRVRVILDRDATARNIRSALFTWLAQALEEDVVTIFFAGHGSPQSPDSPSNLYLLPHDTDYSDVAASAFPMWDIETALQRHIKANRVIVIADACRSGGVGESFNVARRAGRALQVLPVSSRLEQLSNVQEGVCVITASGDNQFSQEGKQWGGGHGVFTHFLLNGLNGEADYNHDGRATLGEMVPYLSEQVRRATSNAQCPTVAGKFDPALAIGR